MSDTPDSTTTPAPSPADDLIHTVDDGIASGTQSSGTFQRTFSAAGAYPYHCTIHGAAMSGTVNQVRSSTPQGCQCPNWGHAAGPTNP